MSVIENIDNTINELIAALVAEYKEEGFFKSATVERKSEIIEEIAKLRDSMNPKCDCKK